MNDSKQKSSVIRLLFFHFSDLLAAEIIFGSSPAVLSRTWHRFCEGICLENIKSWQVVLFWKDISIFSVGKFFNRFKPTLEWKRHKLMLARQTY
jgi:hypothetical protein